MKLKDIVRTVAPALATALGGPLAGSAVRVLSEKFLGKPDGTPEELEAVLVSATPAQLIEMRKLDLDFKAQLIDAGIKLEEIAANDRQGARGMFTATRDPTVTILTISVVLVWGTVQYALFTQAIPEGSHDMIVRMLGTLDAALLTVLTFWFGSSIGSKKKDDIAAQAAK
jgi:hypothetical protein